MKFIIYHTVDGRTYSVTKQHKSWEEAEQANPLGEVKGELIETI